MHHACMTAVDMQSNPRPTHWASVPEAGLTIGLWFVYACHAVFGRVLYRALMWPVSWYFVAVRPLARRASIDYQQRLGVLAGDVGRWSAWRAAARHVRHFADALLDKALVWTGGLEARRNTPRSRSALRSAVDENRGGVLVVAHFGNLEVLRRMGEYAKQLRLHILVHTRHAERFNRMLTRVNPQSAERLLQVTEVDTATIAHLAARVELGDFVVIAADRVPVTSQRDERRAAPSSSRAPWGARSDRGRTQWCARRSVSRRRRSVSDRAVGVGSRARLPRVLAGVLSASGRSWTLHAGVRVDARPHRAAAQDSGRGVARGHRRLCALPRTRVPRSTARVV